MQGYVPPSEAKLNDVLEAMLLAVQEQLLADGFSQDIADQESTKIVSSICRSIGGIQVYIPKQDALKRAQRDKQIYAKFNGSNHQQLALEYGLSEQAIYTITKNQRAMDVAKRQKQLF